MPRDAISGVALSLRYWFGYGFAPPRWAQRSFAFLPSLVGSFGADGTDAGNGDGDTVYASYLDPLVQKVLLQTALCSGSFGLEGTVDACLVWIIWCRRY